jgi:F420-0:gamma-glutamyl ligase
MEKAVVKLRELSADEKARDLYERREKACRDIASMLDEAETRRAQTIARNALQMNIPIDDIVKFTGLAREEIETL